MSGPQQTPQGTPSDEVGLAGKREMPLHDDRSQHEGQIEREFAQVTEASVETAQQTKRQTGLDRRQVWLGALGVLVAILTLFVAILQLDAQLRPPFFPGGSTASPIVQASQTSRVGTTVTATQHPTPTVTARPAATSPSGGPTSTVGADAPTATPASPGWPFSAASAMYFSSMAADDGHWLVHSSATVDPDYRCDFEADGTYHSWWQNFRGVPCSYNAPPQTTLALEVQAASIAGQGYNINFDTDTANYSFGYFVAITGSGSYEIHRIGTVTPLASGSVFPAITLTQRNTIGIIARNGVIELWINHQHITTSAAGSYTPLSGNIALEAASSSGGPTEASFANVFVWTA